MTLSDLDEITDTFEKDFPCSWKVSTLKSELNNLSSQYILIRSASEIIGFAGVWLSVDDAHITNIVVKNSYRNKGIGSLLLEKLIEITKENCKVSLTLEVNTKNIYAQKLYNKYNFKNLGIRKKYYNGTDDAFIMTLYL
jgi:ribosomal-protein-alanine N-acetyltransferase